MSARSRKIAAVLAALVAPFTAYGESVKVGLGLPEPQAEQALETLSRGVAATLHAPGQLFYLALAKPYSVVMPLQMEAATRAQIFGPVTGQIRLPAAGGDWVGMVDGPTTRILLDGTQMAMVEFDPKTMQETNRRTIAWDLLKPPRDRGGEGTTREIQELRQLFKKRLIATEPPRFVGIAPLNGVKGFSEAGGGTLAVVASRIPGFPLLLMRCDADQPSSCMIVRQCRLTGDKPKPESVTRVAVSAKRRLLLLGDEANNSVMTYRLESCLASPHVKTLALPPHLKTLTSLNVDQDDRLWIGTATPDDFLNSSLFYWPAKSW